MNVLLFDFMYWDMVKVFADLRQYLVSNSSEMTLFTCLPVYAYLYRNKLAPGVKGPPRASISSHTKKSSSLMGDHEGHGVPLGDEETIMAHMDAFCNRIRQILDVINTLSQFVKCVCVTTQFGFLSTGIGLRCCNMDYIMYTMY